MGRRTRVFSRGRQVEGVACSEIKTLLGDLPRKPDLLIEFLHRVQDCFGHISEEHLAALAQELNLPMAQVYEVVTFYAHFDFVRAGQAPPPQITVRVCDSLSCQLKGAEQLKTALQQAHDPAQVRVVRVPCMGRCDSAPIAQVGHRHLDQATADTVSHAVNAGLVHPQIPVYRTYDDYLAEGGYGLLQRCRGGDIDYDELSRVLGHAGLRGMGGAGFPTATKWKFVKQEPGPRLMVVNADEGEPGTFKDRYYLETDPHRVLEGMLVSAWAVEAQAVYIYLRDEYPAIREILHRELALLVEAQVVPPGYIHLRRGAGSYICGEESALIESIEGKRGYPRQRPPYVAHRGLFNRPTLVNNVETLYWIREIVEKGPDWFAAHGRNGGKGLRSFSVSGRVADPGVKVAAAGISVRELIEEYCGGMSAGHRLKAYLPGGPSGGILPASMADLPLDFGALEAQGCLIGSAAVIVLSQADDIRDVVLNLMRFFEDESCGQCTPCRSGTQKIVQLLEAGQRDKILLEPLAQVMRDASICGLGQAASNPIFCAMRFFADEFLGPDHGGPL